MLRVVVNGDTKSYPGSIILLNINNATCPFHSRLIYQSSLYVQNTQVHITDLFGAT
jgi:hypothetical protein